MNKRILSILTIILMFSMILTACSAPAEEPAAAADSPQEEEAAPVEAAEEEEKVEEAAVVEEAEVEEEAPAEKASYKIGLSWNRKDLVLINAWEQYALQVSDEIEEAEGVELEWIINVADGDPARQASNIEDLINQDVDIIIARAEDGAAIGSSITAAQDAGIPFITFDRESMTVKPAVHVGADSQDQAISTANYLADLFEENNIEGKCIEIIGDLKDQNAVYRSDGWHQVEDERGAWETVVEVPTEWNSDLAIAGLRNGFNAHPEINCIFLASDEWAALTTNILEEYGILFPTGEEGHVWFAGQDVSIPGYAALMDGYMDVGTSYDAYEHSKALVEAVYKVLTGQEVDELILVKGRVVTTDNVRETENLWGRDFGDYQE